MSLGMIWFLVSVALLLVIAVFCALSHDKPDHPEEIVGDMVDIKQFFKRWDDEI